MEVLSDNSVLSVEHKRAKNLAQSVLTLKDEKKEKDTDRKNFIADLITKFSSVSLSLSQFLPLVLSRNYVTTIYHILHNIIMHVTATDR